MSERYHLSVSCDLVNSFITLPTNCSNNLPRYSLVCKCATASILLMLMTCLMKAPFVSLLIMAVSSQAAMYLAHNFA